MTTQLGKNCRAAGFGTSASKFNAAKIKKNQSEEISVITKKAEGTKCPVCWKINKSLCERHG